MSDFAQGTCIVGSGGSAVQVVENAVLVNTRSEWDQAVSDGRAFTWASLTYDPDGHDTILGVQNTSKTHLLKIKKIISTTDAAGLIQVFTSVGITMSGTVLVVGVNLNRSSGRLAEATAYCDETVNAEQAGGYATKLLQKQIAADVPDVIDVDGAIVLPYSHEIGVDFTTAATAGNVTIWGWFEPI